MTFTGIATVINTALYGLSFNSNVTGSDTLQITVNDPDTLSSHQDQASNSVSIYVSNLKAVGDSATTTINTAVAIPVLANDTGATSIVSTTDPSNGTVSVSGSTIIYTPNADFSGPDVFSYKITDGHGNYDETTVNVSVTDVTPEDLDAEDDTADTAIGTPVTIDVLDNDSGFDGAPTLQTGPPHGSVSLSGTQYIYTPAPGFTGTDSFQYSIEDDEDDTATATVQVTVAPVVVLFNINNTPETSDDVAFLYQPLPVTVVLEAPEQRDRWPSRYTRPMAHMSYPIGMTHTPETTRKWSLGTVNK